MRLVPWFWTLVAFLSLQLCKLRLDVVVHCRGRPPAGATLVCAKHATGLDIPLLANLCRRLGGYRPFFQMGSFVGYPILGHLLPFMRRLGGFEVMRPKEVHRLSKLKGWDRGRARDCMLRVNQEAEGARAAVLRSGGALVVFPEGTRDATQVRALVSGHEVQTALAVVAEGIPVSIWPVVLSYGRSRLFRRRAVVEFRQPFKLDQADEQEVLERLSKEFAAGWMTAPEVDSGVDPHSRDSSSGVFLSTDGARSGIHE